MDKLVNLFSNVFSIDFNIDLDNNRKTTTSRKTGERLPIFADGEDVSCTATVNIKPGRKLEHNGIKVELVGQIVLSGERSSNYEFYTIAKDLEPPGTLMKPQNYQWKFKSVDKQFETYEGVSVDLRYFVRFLIQRNFLSNISKEADFVVQNVSPPPNVNNTIKLEVGIEEFLHIEFEYNKSKYHLNDVIIGKVYFLKVRIRIKSMEIEILRHELTGSAVETETLTKFEIMDGNPIKLESIPVRLYLGGINVTPTYKNIQNKFSVKYLINLVLIDDEDRRYFKKQEIVFWRKEND